MYLIWKAPAFCYLRYWRPLWLFQHVKHPRPIPHLTLLPNLPRSPQSPCYARAAASHSKAVGPCTMNWVITTQTHSTGESVKTVAAGFSATSGSPSLLFDQRWRVGLLIHPLLALPCEDSLKGRAPTTQASSSRHCWLRES